MRRFVNRAVFACVLLAPAPLGAQPDPAAPAPPPPAGDPAQPYGQPVSAGGLDAPAPIDTESPKPKSETEQQLDEAEKEDSGRRETWFWIDIEGGYQYVGLESFTVNEEKLTAGFEHSDASGGYVGAGIGAQIILFRLGPRFRIGFFNEWQLYSIDGELGLRIPIGILEPHVELAVGYSALGNVSGLFAAGGDPVQISGYNIRAGGGLDIFPGTEYFSLGAVFSWEVLGMTRPGVDQQTIAQLQASGQADQAKAELLAAEGSGYGTSICLGARLGLHF